MKILRILFISTIYFVSTTTYSQVELPDIPKCDSISIPNETSIDTLIKISLSDFETNTYKSLCYLQESLKKSNNRNTKTKIGLVARRISQKLYQTYNYKEAVYFESLSGKIWFDLDSTKQYCTSLRKLGYDYYRLGDIYNTIKYESMALPISRAHNYTKEEYLILYEIAWSKWRINQFDEALKYLKLAKEIIDKEGMTKKLPLYFNSLSQFYEGQGKIEEAIINIGKAIELAIKYNNKRIHGVALSNKAGYLINNKARQKEMFDLVYKALEINKEMGDKEQLGSNYGLLSNCYYSVNNFKQSEKMAFKSLKYSQEIGDLPRVLISYDVLKKTYSKLNQYSKAFLYSEKHAELYSKLYGTKNITKIFDLESKYATERNKNIISKFENDKKISALKSKQNKQLLLLISIISLLLLSGILLVFFRNKTNQKIKNEALKVKSSNELLQMEMEALRARMNPHFLFNSLNSIKSFIIKSDTKNASDYLTKFATLVRMILNHSKEKTISLSEELKAISYYIEIEKMRLKDMFEYRLVVADEINLDEIQIPPSILQPFVENAIWHGFMGLKKNGLLSITISQIEDETVITIQDNGIGRKAAGKLKLKKGKHKSTGLKIIDNTIEVYKKKDILDLHIEIIDLFDDVNKPSGTKIHIAIKN